MAFLAVDSTQKHTSQRGGDTIDIRRTLSSEGASHFLLEERSLRLDCLTPGQFVFWHED